MEGPRGSESRAHVAPLLIEIEFLVEINNSTCQELLK